MGWLYTKPELRDDGTGNYYHFTSNLKTISDSRSVWGNANGCVYVVGHQNNYNLGINTDLGKLQVVVFQPGCGVEFKKCAWPTLYLTWKGCRGEFTGRFANDIQILRQNEDVLSVDGRNIKALYVKEAKYVPQSGATKTYSIWRACAMYSLWNFEATIAVVTLGIYSKNWLRPFADLALHVMGAVVMAWGLAFIVMPVGCIISGRKSGRMPPLRSSGSHLLSSVRQAVRALFKK
ncbi:hypothetical protein [Herbaspirillum sp. VT-16-41]|uniref:hypothetical protein n=1 Tax=Herbaspirillum sp. VT-16-41 TaxID=1953765 RepID=UPI0011156F7F|nr:hypothetical protein [Herbaspirillum sp. VT-16-41]